MVNPKMKILVVDDFATIRRILRTLLKKIGLTNVIEAEDGSTALNVLKKNEVDLIICDWNMPYMSGIELLKAVKGDESLKDIPFLMLTAEGQKEKVSEAVQAGVTNYIVKPFTADGIQEKLTQIFGE
jgi:two-component system chemotaxis response regulator CheY